jgi:hypothetical protein
MCEIFLSIVQLREKKRKNELSFGGDDDDGGARWASW